MKKNIFISYGHGQYDKIVKKLADDIRKQGFQVFVDSDYLKVGDDWEEILDQHIRNADFFLFLSSERSVSGDGYCKNEICRAEECKVKIIPIMLDKSLLPLSINKLQRLSLIESITPEYEVIEVKYEQVFRDLMSVLSGTSKIGFSDIDVHLESVLKPISSREFMFRHYNSFCGREKAFAHFEDFLSSNKNFLWVSAQPGAGKTAFSSMLVWKYPQYVRAVHFCKFNNSDRANPKNIISSIVHQLTMSFPEYKNKIANLNDLGSIFEKNERRMLELLMVNPLAEMKVEQPVVIVIDALDEISWRGTNEICKILQESKNSFPKWLKFVLTSRSETDIEQILSTFTKHYELSDEENEEDIRYYYRKEFPEASEEQIKILLSKSEGSFLYATEIVKQIHEEQLSLDDINVFPVGIYGFFIDWFDRIFKREEDKWPQFEEVRPILEFLCISPEPVDIDFLQDYLKIDEYTILKNYKVISGLFPQSNGYIEPLHRSLVDWLINENGGTKHSYYVSKKNAYRKLLEYTEEKYSNKEYANSYVVKYFADTLMKLKMHERLAEIMNDEKLQLSMIEKLEFDSGLEKYLAQLEYLKKENPEACEQLLSDKVFIKIFSRNRRLLYNSGLFIQLRDIGLSVVLRKKQTNWGTEGEIGKVFYYYIVEDFANAIRRAKALLALDDIQNDNILKSELYNVKGLSERKLVEFDEALESFEKCIEASEASIDENRDNSDVEFELSLAYLIISKINMHMMDFSACNKSCKKACKILSRKIDEMPEGDKKISNTLFLAEEYRVFANAYIMQREYELADEMLARCEEIYQQYKNSTDRYYIRYCYTGLFLKIMQKETEGVLERLYNLLEKFAKSKYDKGILYYYIALCIYISGTEDVEELKRGFQAARDGVETFDSIDSLLEKAECNLLANKLSKLCESRYLSDDDDNKYIDAWVEYLDAMIEEIRDEQ